MIHPLEGLQKKVCPLDHDRCRELPKLCTQPGSDCPKTILSCALPDFPAYNCTMFSAAPFRTGSARRAVQAVGADFLPGLCGALVSAEVNGRTQKTNGHPVIRGVLFGMLHG
jgi:hypothetical protein